MNTIASTLIISSGFPEEPETNYNFNQLSDDQLAFISQAVDNAQPPLGMYRCLPTIEVRRMVNEMENEEVGSIQEANASLADILSGADRRYFWKKTPVGLYQVITNRAINRVEEARLLCLDELSI